MKFKTLLLCLLVATFAQAQNDWRIANHTQELRNVERIVLPTQNNDQLLADELERRGPGIAPKYAISMDVNITPQSNGTWEQTPSGKSVWRLRINSEDAKSINFGFTKFFMPPGGMLVLYSEDKKIIRGPFTPADNEEHEQLWTPIFPGDEVVIEVQLPEASRSALQLELTTINHDFMGFGAVVSGSCNVDVICGIDNGFPQIEDHRDIIQSVAVIGTGNGTFCTGFLVNNVRQDCTPYFMTANHCNINNGNAPSLVAYWNFQNSTCREPGSTASGEPGNGQLNNFNTGAIFRAGSGNSDFTIVELDDPVNESADAFFAGWDNSGDAPSSAIGIHHPSTDEKRISFENDPLIFTNGFGNSPSSSYTHVRVQDWDIGTTEPGSSGSPLFDQNERVVGQLHGGGAACGNNQSDWYGAIGSSWNGSSASTRLKDWLDPDESGVLTLDGTPVMNCGFVVNPTQQNILACPTDDAVFELIVSGNFESEVTLDFSNIPAGASSSASATMVNPGDTVYLTITGINNLAVDDYIINVDATDGVNSSMSLLVLSAIDTPNATTLNNPSDGATNISQNATFVWAAVPSASGYMIELATDAAFTNIINQNTVNSTGFSTSGLGFGVLYYWRVTSINNCGETTSSTSSFTTSLDLGMTTNTNNVGICSSETATFTVTIGDSFDPAGATLSATGLPTGGTATFSPNPLLPGMSASMVLDNLEAGAGGNYVVTIIADDGTNSNDKDVTLVLQAPPVPAALNTPMNNATEVVQTPQFIWAPSVGATEYTIEVATDVDFNNIVATNTTNITVYTVPTELEASTVHYWRVSAEGTCGGSQSLVRNFTTIIIDDVSELNNAQVDIRPNPTNGLINVSLSSALPGNLRVEVYAINGQQLIRQVRTGETQFEVSLENYPTGVYLLKLVNDQNVLTKKMILQK